MKFARKVYSDRRAYPRRKFLYQEAVVSRTLSQNSFFFPGESERRFFSEEKLPEHGLAEPAFMNHQVTPVRDLVVLDPGQLLRHEPLQLERDELIIVALPKVDRASGVFEWTLQLHRVKLPFPEMDHNVPAERLVLTLLPDFVLQQKTSTE